MLRAVFVPALALLLSAVGWIRSAEAGITYDVVFRSTGTPTVTFSYAADARAATPVMDLYLVTTDHLILNAVSVGWDDSRGLRVAGAVEWDGLFNGGLINVIPEPSTGVLLALGLAGLAAAGRPRR